MPLKRILCGILLAASAAAQTNTTTNGAMAFPFANSSSGTALYHLVKQSSTGATTLATSDTSGSIGVCIGTCGTSGTAGVAQVGLAPILFDNTPVANDYVQISPTIGGAVHDTGATLPSTGQVIGQVSNTTPVTTGVYLVNLIVSSASSGGGSGNVTGAGLTALHIVTGSGASAITVDAFATLDGSGNAVVRSLKTGGTANGAIGWQAIGTPAAYPTTSNTVQRTVQNSSSTYDIAYPTQPPGYFLSAENCPDGRGVQSNCIWQTSTNQKNVVYADAFTQAGTNQGTWAAGTYAACSLVTYTTQPTTALSMTASVALTANGDGTLTVTAISTGTVQFGESLYQGTTLIGTREAQISGTTNGIGTYLVHNASAASSGTTTGQFNGLYLSAIANNNTPIASSGVWAFLSYMTPWSANLVPTATDCAFAYAKAMMQGTTVGTILRLGSGNNNQYQKCMPWELQALWFARVSIDGTYYDDAKQSGTDISNQDACLLSEANIVAYPDPGLNSIGTAFIKNVNLLNFTSASAPSTKGEIELTGMLNTNLEHVHTRDMTVGYPVIKLGHKGIPGDYIYQTWGKDIQGGTFLGGIPSVTRANITVNLTGGSLDPTTPFTIVNGGSYGASTGGYQAVWMPNGTIAPPCSTMPDIPAFTLSGGSSGAVATVVPGSGMGVNCVGLYLQIVPNGQATCFIDSNDQSDSHFFDIEVNGQYTDAALCINNHGGNNFDKFHPVGGNGSFIPYAIDDHWGGNFFISFNSDTTDGTSVYQDDSSGLHEGDTFISPGPYWPSISRPQGGAGFYQFARTITQPIWIENMLCASSGTQPFGYYAYRATGTGASTTVTLPNPTLAIVNGTHCSTTSDVVDNTLNGRTFLATPIQTTQQVISTSATTLPTFTGSTATLSASAAFTTITVPTFMQTGSTACFKVLAINAWTFTNAGNIVTTPFTAVVNHNYDFCYQPTLGTPGWTIQ